MAEITLADLAKARGIQEAAGQQESSREKEGGALRELEEQMQAPAFSEEERKRIEEIKGAIDLTDSQAAVQYGVGAQRSLAEFG